MCIDVATELEIPVHIILPKPVIESAPGKISLTEGFAGDFLYEQGNFLKREWNKALAFIRKALSGADGWTCRIINGSQTDPPCYCDAGVQVIDAADVFLAVWDRQSARGLGTTAEMVDHAEILQMPTMICDPQSGQLQECRFKDFSPVNDGGQLLIESLQLAPMSSCRQQMPEFSFLKKRLKWHVKATGLLATRSLFSKCLEFHFSLLAWHRAQKFAVSVLPGGCFCDFLSFPA